MSNFGTSRADTLVSINKVNIKQKTPKALQNIGSFDAEVSDNTTKITFSKVNPKIPTTIIVQQSEPITATPAETVTTGTKKRRIRSTDPNTKLISSLKRKRNISYKEFLLLKYTIIKWYIVAFWAKYFILILITYMTILSILNIYLVLGIDIKDLLANILLLSWPEEFDISIYEGSNTLIQFFHSIYKNTLNYIDHFRALETVQTTQEEFDTATLCFPYFYPTPAKGVVSGELPAPGIYGANNKTSIINNQEAGITLPPANVINPTAWSEGLGGVQTSDKSELDGTKDYELAEYKLLRYIDRNYANLPNITECPYIKSKNFHGGVAAPTAFNETAAGGLYLPKGFIGSKNHYTFNHSDTSSLFLKFIIKAINSFYNLIFNSSYFPSLFKSINLPLVVDKAGVAQPSYINLYTINSMKHVNLDIVSWINHSSNAFTNPENSRDLFERPEADLLPAINNLSTSPNPLDQGTSKSSEVPAFITSSTPLRGTGDILSPNVKDSYKTPIINSWWQSQPPLFNSSIFEAGTLKSKQFIYESYIFMKQGISHIFYETRDVLWNWGSYINVFQDQRISESSISSDASSPTKYFDFIPNLKITSAEDNFSFSSSHTRVNPTNKFKIMTAVLENSLISNPASEAQLGSENYDSSNLVTGREIGEDMVTHSPNRKPGKFQPTLPTLNEEIKAFTTRPFVSRASVVLPENNQIPEKEVVKTTLSLSIPGTPEISPILNKEVPVGSSSAPGFEFTSSPYTNRSPLLNSIYKESSPNIKGSPILETLREKDYDIKAMGHNFPKLSKGEFISKSPIIQSPETQSPLERFLTKSPFQTLWSTPESSPGGSGPNVDFWDNTNFNFTGSEQQDKFIIEATARNLLVELNKICDIDNKLTDIHQGIIYNFRACDDLKQDLSYLKDKVFPDVLQKYNNVSKDCTSSIDSLKTLELQVQTTDLVSGGKRTGVLLEPMENFQDVLTLVGKTDNRLNIYLKTLNDYGLMSYNYDNKLYKDLNSLDEIILKSIQLKHDTTNITLDLQKKIVSYIDKHKINNNKDHLNTFWDIIRYKFANPNFSLRDKLISSSPYERAPTDANTDFLDECITSYKNNLERNRNQVKFYNSSIVPIKNSYNRLSWGANNFNYILDDFNRSLKTEDKNLYEIMSLIPPRYK